MLPAPRPGIAEIAPCPHGGCDPLELERAGIDPTSLLDFSSNVNAYGPPPGVREAVAGVDLAAYPDPRALVLRRRLALELGVEAAEVAVGNGAGELIWLLTLAYACPGRPVLILGPTYGEYRRAAALAGAPVLELRAPEATGFVHDERAVLRELARRRPGMVFVCNPNNPTGTLLDPARLAAWAAEAPWALWVVDESYVDFAVGEPSVLPWRRPHVVVLRSLTKAHGLAGLRLGYAVAAPEVVAYLERIRPPWSVNAAAQAAGVAALDGGEHVRRTAALLRSHRAELAGALAGLGFEALPSATHFFLLRAGDGAGLRRRLLARGILVRDCASFGLPGHVRIAARRPEENARLAAALAAEPVEGVYASDLRRAVETARPVAARHGLDARPDPRLRGMGDAG